MLALRSAPDDIEILNAIFRSAHSIKGGAGSFGLESLVRFTHALEDLLDRMRAMEVSATDQVIAVLLESIDVLRSLLERGADGRLSDSEIELVERIEAHASAECGPQPVKESSVAPSTSKDNEPPSAHESEPARYKVEFRPKPEMFSSGTNPIVLLRNLAALAQATTCELHANELPPLSELDPERCYLSWTVELATAKPEEELREVFEFVDHIADISIDCIDAAKPTVQLAVTQTPTTSQLEVVKAAPVERSLSVSISATTPASAALDVSSNPLKKSQSKPASSTESSSIRVATDKVDRLIDLVGELVIAHVMTAQLVENLTPECLPRLRESVAAMERNTRELHERVMAVRMLPVGSLFQRYARIVYDIAQSTGKRITLDTDGEDTEIDKSMLELLGDPLTHLIRNAADHGIEAPEARLAAGKPEQGTINLRAFHRSGRIVIEVSDDGAGVDPARVRKKAIERGLITAGVQLSDDQLRMLIFEPGFSTRDEVSDLSGRGVGMDVVKQNVQRLNGAVSLTSEIGSGSTVSIELPLTLAILEGLLVRVADRTLVLPLLSVVETVAPGPGQMQRIAEQGEVVVIRDESVPLIRMRRFLGLVEQSASTSRTSTQPGHQCLVVVVENGGKKIGLVVDELLGQQQVVVKSLERHLHKVDGLMGATILGDGCVAPIIDVAGISAMNLFSLEAPINVSEQLVTRSPVGAGSITEIRKAEGQHMNWFRNLNATPRLLTSFGVMIALTLAMAATEVSNLSKANQRVQNLYESQVMGILYINAMSSAKLDLATRDRDAFIKMSDPVMREVDLSKVKADNAAMNTNLKNAQPLFDSEKGREIIAQMQETLPVYNKQVHEFIDAIEAQDMPDAKLKLYAFAPAAAKLGTQMDQARKFKQQLAAQAFRDNDAAYRNARALLILGCILLSVFGIMLSIIIARTFSMPMGERCESSREGSRRRPHGHT